MLEFSHFREDFFHVRHLHPSSLLDLCRRLCPVFGRKFQRTRRARRTGRRAGRPSTRPFSRPISGAASALNGGGRSIAVSGVKGTPEGGVLRRGRRRPLEDDRRRRHLGAGHRRPDHTARRSAPSPCRNPIPTSSTSAWASRASAATSSRATASTSRPTPARPGRTSASPTPTRSPKIRIHPTNPDIVFVADFGRYGRTSDERGVFKTTDGGKTWSKVLFRDDKTGAVDIAIDRNNPNVMFAALWEAYRVEYQMSSGGPGSGLFKSTDGGEHVDARSRATPACRQASTARSAIARLRRRLESRLRPRRKRERRPVQLRRRGRDVEAGERGAQHPPARRSTTRTSSPTRTTRTSSTC